MPLSLSLYLCICLPHPCQPLTVPRFSPVSGPRPTGVTGHADCLHDIGLHAHPVEDGYQGAESAPEPGGVRRDDHIVVGIKNRRLMSSLPSSFSLFFSLVDYHVYPVSEDPVHHHIENGGGQRVSLRDSPRSLERFAVVSARPVSHGEAVTVGCQQPPGTGADAVALQDLQAPGPVQSVVRFVRSRKITYSTSSLMAASC